VTLRGRWIEFKCVGVDLRQSECGTGERERERPKQTIVRLGKCLLCCGAKTENVRECDNGKKREREMWSTRTEKGECGRASRSKHSTRLFSE
jgi:hypothetical protein